MDLALVVAAAVAGLGGWFAAGWQHMLYRQPEDRVAARGRALLARRVTLGVLAAACGALAFRPGHYEGGPAALTTAFALALLVLASADIERRLLPDRLMLPSIAAAMAAAWAWPDRSPADAWIGGGIAAGVGIGLFVLGQAVGVALGARQTPFGLGDVKLIVLLGFLLGWPAFLSALLLGVLAAGVPGLVLTLRGRARSVFSYGPFLVLGALVVLLFPAAFT